MSATTSANRLDGWLSEVYSAASEVKSIISATGSATSATATSGSDTASSTGTGATGAATGSASNTLSTAVSSTTGNSNTAIGTGSSTINGAGSSVTSAASSASSSAAAAAHHHHSNLLPIILGTVLGALALIALALCIFCCLRRRRSKKRSKRIASPDEDEVHSWRANDRDTSTQPMMGGAAIAGPERYGYPSDPPPMSQHPAYRSLNNSGNTGSSNPFVPPVPPPRKSAPNARPGLTTDSVPGQEPFTSPSPRQPSPKQPSRTDPLAAGVAGLAAGAAAGKVARKPVNKSPSRLETSDLPEPVTPMDGSPRYSGYNYGQSPDQANWRQSGAYDSRIDPRQSYSHNRQPSGQPLMSGSGNDSNNPMSYTEDRPPTPFGLMGMGMGGAAAGSAAAHHHDRQQNNSSNNSDPSSDRSRESYDSAMAYPAPTRSPGRHQTPPNVPSRSPRRARFSDPVEMPSPTQSYGHHSSTQSGNSNNGTTGRVDYGQPSSYHDPSSYHHRATDSDSSRTDSGDSTWRLSSSMPGGWGGHTRESSRTSYPNPSPPTPGGKRMRLSDLRAREEEMERLKEHEGWDEQAAYGRSHGGGYNDPDHGVGMAM